MVPEHWVVLVAEHWPQAPEAWQAGVAPPQSLSAAQARQVWVAVLQTGVPPVQALTLPSEHWPQAPEVWQAGVAPPHSPSPAQARQVWVAVLQTGVMPPHCAFEVQGTQVPVAV